MLPYRLQTWPIIIDILKRIAINLGHTCQPLKQHYWSILCLSHCGRKRLLLLARGTSRFLKWTSSKNVNSLHDVSFFINCRLLTFFKVNFFKISREHYKSVNGLDLDLDRRSVGPDMHPNCLQRFADIDFELKKVLLPPNLGNLSDISYLEEIFKPHLLRDVCTLCSGALVSDSLLHMLL